MAPTSWSSAAPAPRDPDLRDRCLAGRADRAPAGQGARDRDVLGRLRAHRPGGGERARHHRHQHARRADRGHRRPRDAVPAGRGAARVRGRGPDPHRSVGGLDAHAAARPRAERRHARHRRHGPDRPGGGAARARLRHAHPLLQPSAPAARARAGRPFPPHAGVAAARSAASSACTARRRRRPRA